MKQHWPDSIPMYELILMTYKPTGSNCLDSPIRVIFIHLLSAYSAEIELRIKIFRLKSVCGQNFLLFGQSGQELQRFENLGFSKFTYGIVAAVIQCIVYTAAPYSIQMYSIIKTKPLKRCNSCL